MTRVALYARVSTAKQETDNQVEELRRYALARGWEVAGEYVDRGISGAKASRPALNRLMADARERRFDAVIVWKLDRFGRSIRHLLDAVELLTSFGVRFLAVTQGIDTDQSNPIGRLLLSILGAIAEFERDLIRERIAAGVSRTAKSGTKSGKAWGRPRAAGPAKFVEVQQLRKDGLSISQIQQKTNLSRGVVQRACSGIFVGRS